MKNLFPTLGQMPNRFADDRPRGDAAMMGESHGTNVFLKILS